MKLKHTKYLLVYSLPITVAVAFVYGGWLSYLPLIHSFFFIPLLELVFKPDPENVSSVEAELRKADSVYDWMIYLIVPVQWVFLIWFLFVMGQEMSMVERIGKVFAMGLMCGTIGINVAHELGHRVKAHERLLAKVLLLSSLYMHFYIEHNRGHHKNVSTPGDPSSARKNEILHVFWLRSVFTGLVSAWRLEAQRLNRKKQSVFSVQNEMLRFIIIQMALLGLMYVLFGGVVLLSFIGAATIGFLLLESVNYIEHYGLVREKVTKTRYERTMPWHSWNSDHIVGRLMLFELSRHSDHHYLAAKKYQLLDHHNNSPQMPTGYPGMLILANIPPLWFWVMNRRVDYWNAFAKDQFLSAA